MNKLIPFNKFTNNKNPDEMVSDTSVVVDEKGTPMGFVFGRDAFISFLERIDDEFEHKITNQKKAFDNPAGRLIDLIEENLPINPAFIKDMKKSTTRSEWIPFDKVIQALHV